MPKSITTALCAAAILAAAAVPAAAAPERQLLAVTNTTDRVVFCTFLFDTRARTELAIRPGKTWSEAFDPRRDLRLVCQRSKRLFFGPLEAGKTYRLVTAGSKVDVAEGTGE